MTEEGSRISRRIRRTGDLLLGGAQKQVTDYKGRFDSLSGIYDAFLSKMLIPYPEVGVNTEFVDRFFGKRTLSFAGIDGTICKDAVFDLLVFFAGAYAAHGTVQIGGEGGLTLTYDEQCIEKGIGISSVLPVYINEVPVIDQTLLSRDEDGSVDESATPTDSWVIDNSSFADYLMGLAEFYLAYKLVSAENPVDILLLDRVCSSEVSSYYAETSESRIDLARDCGLVGLKVDGRPFTTTDWVYARQVFGNPKLGTPPARGEYLLPRIITELMSEKGGGLSREQLAQRLGLATQSSMSRLDAALGVGIGGKRSADSILVRSHDHFVLKPGVIGLKERVEHLVTEVCGRIFSEDSSVSFDSRFKVDSRWLTTNDLAFLSLMSLHLAVERCWRNKTLLVGIAKDTSARDLKRQLIPVLNYVGRFKGAFDAERQDVPDTDRMILQWVSLRERDRLKVPWATCEYDTAFKTTVPHFEGKPGLVSGARRNQISVNRTFVKAYFQLTQAQSDPKLRSNVLLYDRLAYPDFDTGGDQTLRLKHDYVNKPDEPEPVDVILYLGIDNPVQSFLIKLFRGMTSTSVPELFGHVKPLYIADKIAKYYYAQFASMIESTGSWLLNRPQLREFLFYLSTFREKRSEYEQTRRLG